MTVEPREGEELTDQSIEPLGFLFDPIELRMRGLSGFSTREAGGDTQSGKRRPQFVRDIAQQATLRCDEGFDLAGHRIEVLSEATNFVVPRPNASATRAVSCPAAIC